MRKGSKHTESALRKMRGRVLSEETRRKISAAVSGEKHPCYGKKLSPETCRKISEAHKGRKFTDEHRRHLSERKISAETRKKISEAKRGKKHSEESRRKISESLKGRPCSAKTRDRLIEYNKTREWTDEMRDKISRAHLGRWRGEHGTNWRGGITESNMLIRNSTEYRNWRLSVFRRDHFACVWCGDRKSGIEADHILPFSDHPELRLDINNGRTLCIPCHEKRHGASVSQNQPGESRIYQISAGI